MPAQTRTLEIHLECGDTISSSVEPRIGAYRKCIHCDSNKRVVAVASATGSQGALRAARLEAEAALAVTNPAPGASPLAAAPELENVKPGDVLYVAVGSYYGPQSTEIKTVEWVSDNGSGFRFTDGTYSDVTRVRIKQRGSAILAELEDLKNLADLADEVAEAAADARRDAQDEIRELEQHVAILEQREQRAAAQSQQARAALVAAMRAAGVNQTATGFAVVPVPEDEPALDELGGQAAIDADSEPVR